MSGFLARAAASAGRNAAKWKGEHPRASLPAPPDPPPFLPAGGGRFGLVAEVKRKSPSHGRVMPPGLSPAALARLYLAAGAEAVSVVVEEEHFGGSPSLFAQVREAVPLPLLWKDFVVDPFQVELAAALGASAVLLLVDLLPGGALPEMMALARAQGLRPLVEVHDEPGAQRALAAGADLVGVNHRDLRTLAMDMGLTGRLAPLLAGRDAVAESGLSRPDEAARMRGLGYRAILVGTALAGAADPRGAAKGLLGEVGPDPSGQTPGLSR